MAKIIDTETILKHNLQLGSLVRDSETNTLYIVTEHLNGGYDLVNIESGRWYCGFESLKTARSLQEYIDGDVSLEILPVGSTITLEQE